MGVKIVREVNRILYKFTSRKVRYVFQLAWNVTIEVAESSVVESKNIALSKCYMNNYW